MYCSIYTISTSSLIRYHDHLNEWTWKRFTDSLAQCHKPPFENHCVRTAHMRLLSNCCLSLSVYLLLLSYSFFCICYSVMKKHVAGDSVKLWTLHLKNQSVIALCMIVRVGCMWLLWLCASVAANLCMLFYSTVNPTRFNCCLSQTAIPVWSSQYKALKHHVFGHLATAEINATDTGQHFYLIEVMFLAMAISSPFSSNH